MSRHAAVGGRGDAPVDQVDLEAAGEQLLDHAAVGLQVDDVGPVDQGVADQDRLGVDGGGVAAIAEQAERVFLVDDLGGRGADLDVAGPVDDPGHGEEPAPHLERRLVDGLLLGQGLVEPLFLQAQGDILNRVGHDACLSRHVVGDAAGRPCRAGGRARRPTSRIPR